jgi:hypothetical protein
MLGKKKQKLGAYASFESMREEGEDPRTANRLTRQIYNKTHANDERTVLPLQMYGKIGTDAVEVEEKETITRKTLDNWEPEELTKEDIEKLKEIWIDMTEDEKFIIQKKVYRNNAGGEYERRTDILKFYTRFKPIPEEYMPDNLTQEIEDSDEYQEWAHHWLAKRDAFVKAMRALVPELVAHRERLIFGEPIEGGERPVVNVPNKGYDIKPEDVEEAKRMTEENIRNAAKEKEKKKLIAQEARKEAARELGIPDKEEIDLEKEQEKMQNKILKEEKKQLERLGKLEAKKEAVMDKISTIQQMLRGGESKEE